MIDVSVLFVLAGLFAVGAIIAQWYQRRRRASEHGRKPAQLEQKRPPKVVELSNHGARMLAEVERKRQESEEAIRIHQAALDTLNTDAAKIRSGLEGEARLDDFLRNQLDDEWTIIAGYHAHKGEIDRILVGPRGVFAIEVKNLSGVIHCDGDRWWRDKTDRSGNVLERGIPIVDNGVRSPSRQINETADALEQMLSENGCDISVSRVIVFTNPRATFGDISNLSVNYLANIQGMSVEKVLSCGRPLSNKQAFLIATTIRRHHEWYKRKEQKCAAYRTRSMHSMSSGQTLA